MDNSELQRAGLLCRLGFHNWAKWSNPQPYTPAYQKQDRRCIDCGKAQERVF